MELCNIINQLLNQHRLADTCTREQTSLTTLGKRRNKINHLDACF